VLNLLINFAAVTTVNTMGFVRTVVSRASNVLARGSIGIGEQQQHSLQSVMDRFIPRCSGIYERHNYCQTPAGPNRSVPPGCAG
jgi:hypothetical protein